MNVEIKEIQKEIGVSLFPITKMCSTTNIINLFYDLKQEIDYSLHTDGSINHLDTWIDKRPWNRDCFLKGASSLKRFEFEITEANIILLEKKYQQKEMRILYIDKEIIYKILHNNIYSLSINEKENIKIKRMEKLNWK